jgi:hypothetical protein
MEDKPLFEMKPVEESGRVKVSKYNALKNFKYADLPAECNDCIYRKIEAGGNGKCKKYEENATCAYRKDIKGYMEQLDTRNPEDLKTLLSEFIQIMSENVLISAAQMKMDGNIPDKNTISQLNAVMKCMTLMSELSGKVEVKETTELDEKGMIKSIFKEMSASKHG